MFLPESWREKRLLRDGERRSVKENLTHQPRQGYVDGMDSHSAATSAVRAMSTRELAQHLKASHDEFTSRNDHDSELISTVMVQLGEALGRCGQLYAGVPGLGPPRHLVMQGISEQHPAGEWRQLFDRTWASYRSWFFGGSGPGSTAAEAERALRHHMPELIETWERLRNLGGGGSDVGHFLTMWNPPPFAPGCSQLVVAEPERTLVRNYDYAPELFEGVSMSSRWSDRSVVGTSDCLWGLVDGMNDRGLVASLTFGGVVGTGQGFAIPLVLRYLLEVCDTVGDARSVLRRVPVAGHYNLTFSDAEGSSMTVFVGPGRDPEFSRAAHATNHRGLVPDDPQLARRLRSVERQDTLIALERRGATAASVVDSFRSPGLRSLDFDAGFGTLYTAEYQPDRGSVTYHWPSHDWVRSFRSASEQIRVRLQ